MVSTLYNIILEQIYRKKKISLELFDLPGHVLIDVYVLACTYDLRIIPLTNISTFYRIILTNRGYKKIKFIFNLVISNIPIRRIALTCLKDLRNQLKQENNGLWIGLHLGRRLAGLFFENGFYDLSLEIYELLLNTFLPIYYYLNEQSVLQVCLNLICQKYRCQLLFGRYKNAIKTMSLLKTLSKKLNNESYNKVDIYSSYIMHAIHFEHVNKALYWAQITLNELNDELSQSQILTALMSISQAYTIGYKKKEARLIFKQIVHRLKHFYGVDHNRYSEFLIIYSQYLHYSNRNDEIIGIYQRLIEFHKRRYSHNNLYLGRLHICFTDLIALKELKHQDFPLLRVGIKKCIFYLKKSDRDPKGNYFIEWSEVQRILVFLEYTTYTSLNFFKFISFNQAHDKLVTFIKKYARMFLNNNHCLMRIIVHLSDLYLRVKRITLALFLAKGAFVMLTKTPGPFLYTHFFVISHLIEIFEILNDFKNYSVITIFSIELPAHFQFIINQVNSCRYRNLHKTKSRTVRQLKALLLTFSMC